MKIAIMKLSVDYTWKLYYFRLSHFSIFHLLLYDFSLVKVKVYVLGYMIMESPSVMY